KRCFSRARRGPVLNRSSSYGLPPVSAKPKPSMVWKRCASSTVSSGNLPASEEQCSCVCVATTAAPSGVVSTSRNSPSCRALDDKEENSKAQDENSTNFSFMRPPALRRAGFFPKTNGCAQTEYVHTRCSQLSQEIVAS